MPKDLLQSRSQDPDNMIHLTVKQERSHRNTGLMDLP